MSEQTRTESAIEASVNTLSGFLLAMAIWQFFIPIWYPHLRPTIEENFLMTIVFTAASIIRGYAWRRFFARKLYKVVRRWLTRFAAFVTGLVTLESVRRK